ncbi:MAG TPA: ABC transporter permease [Thermoanaerobaculia bacterium]|nr:ABC transporter permease [Thermoanaerobaculia bacterium]
MSGYLGRRLLTTAATLIGITLVVFGLMHLAPGDPALLLTGAVRGGRVPPPDVLEAIRAEHGLDRSLGAQYLAWAAAALRFDFGDSLAHRRPVRTVIAERIPATLLLNGLALLVALAIGIPLGVAAAARPGSLVDRGSAVVLFLLYSLPAFWVALLLIELFAVRLGVLPLMGMSSSGASVGRAGGLADRLEHLVLPVTVLAYGQIAFFARFVRSALRETLGTPFIRTARAKGAGSIRVLWIHGFRNTLVPLISLAGLVIPWLVSGSVVVEQIFQWDGIGRLFFGAVLARDYPLVLGLAVVTAVVTMAVSLCADLLYAVADPRVRVGEGR